jgi:hypothetical protein
MVALLGEAPAGRHVCQFDCDSDPLPESIALFAAGGLQRGDAVVLVAPSEQNATVLALLERDAIDIRAACASGQLRVMSSRDKLAECSRAGQPDLECLKGAIDGLLEGIPAEWRKRIRVYGEMVNELWQGGHAALAVRLEEHWNELARRHPLSLFCGYTLDGLAESTYTGPFSEIGRTHTNILPTSDDERFRAAVDAATEDVLGISFSLILSCSAREQTLGEHRLPIGRRTLLWLHRNMPVTSGHILERARHYLQQVDKPDAAVAG